jgi:hypothetical protein
MVDDAGRGRVGARHGSRAFLWGRLRDMPKLDSLFLSELQSALSRSAHASLAASVKNLSIHSLVEGRKPVSQFIYVTDRNTLPSGALEEIILEVPGLFCVFVHDGKIVALETLGRNVLDNAASDG